MVEGEWGNSTLEVITDLGVVREVRADWVSETFLLRLNLKYTIPLRFCVEIRRLMKTTPGEHGYGQNSS